MSDKVWQTRGNDIRDAMGNVPFVRLSIEDVLEGGQQADVAFVSRDVTGASTKFDIKPDTQRFYDAMLVSQDLKWVHVHSAGADRFVYLDLMDRGVTLTTSAGANAPGVAQTTVAAILALSRRLPELMQCQREHRWQTLLKLGIPPDLDTLTIVIVGWGPIGQLIGQALKVFGVRLVVVRNNPQPVDIADKVIGFEDFESVLPETDWLVLACPLTDKTKNLVSAKVLDKIKQGAMIANISRGAVVDEQAMIEKLRQGHLAGGYLDVFNQEPLPPDSPIWDLPNTIVTAHTASFSQGMFARMENMFIENLRRYAKGEPLKQVASR